MVYLQYTPRERRNSKLNVLNNVKSPYTTPRTKIIL